MKIRKANYQDIDGIEKVYNDVHDAEEAGKCTTGWKRGIYPVRETAEAALERGDLFVMTENDEIIGTAIINQIQVDVYADAPWEKDVADNEVCVLHTMSISPRVGRRGYGREFVRYYEEYAFAHCCHELRIDTNARNKVARKMYKNAGYKEIAIVPTIFNGLRHVDLVLLEKDLSWDPEDVVISVDRMRRSDAYTIERYIPGHELMYRAAFGVYQSYCCWQGRNIAIIVGGGNNGGDGYALAGILKDHGIDSVIYTVSDKMSDDGKYYHDIASSLGIPILNFDKVTDLNGYDVIVDCILGTGFKGEVRGRAADAIAAINDTEAYVVSVDINSGMNGDTGEAILAVKSDLTVSIGYFKQGLFKGEACNYIGELKNIDIGIVLVH